MEKKWWHDKVAYQIYPKSFCDTNGDGIGDIKGIISKLDYLKDLGIDIIWISPMYKSPMIDQGYDIADYYNIDPGFGTMEDMDELLKEAKKRNMYILMDLVVNHCSSEHEWFKKALKDPEGKYGKYFYIKEGKGDNPPTNWRSYFGGSTWEKIPNTNKYYLHSFAKEQPDLNWENEEVKEEIYKMINWWLDKGLAGFRIDAIINIQKNLEFKDYPCDRDDNMSSIINMIADADGVIGKLNELKHRTFEKYDAFTVGEVFNDKEEEMKMFIGEDGCFSSMFDFSTVNIGKSVKGCYDWRRITTNEYRDAIFESQKKTMNIGFKANIIENHDEPRGVSHYINKGECTEISKKMLAGILMMLRGLPFIYQGQEIGMTNNNFKSIDEIDDIETKNQYNIAIKAGKTEKEALELVCEYSRDNARTPFQWNNSKNAGFTSGKPWLVINDNYKEINAEAQTANKDSLFYFYKDLIKLRKNEKYKDIIVYGNFTPILNEYDNMFAFVREYNEKKIVVIANYQNEKRNIPNKFNLKEEQILMNNYDYINFQDEQIELYEYQIIIAEV